MDIKKYENKYGIKRDIEGDDCEFEVTKQAMIKYLKYPCYKTWEPFLYGGTKEHYLCYSRVLKDGFRGDEGYKGAYLLRNVDDTLVLTADILTEIKSPIGKIVENPKSVPTKGEDIVKMILDNKLSLDNDEIYPYLFSFAFVYYWCGNMLPTPSNPLRLSDRGTWRNKVLVLNGNRQEENEKNWPKWKEWKVPDNWIKDFYFQDAFDNGKVKPFYQGLEAENQVYFSKRPDFNQKLWFLNNTKLIIQRSYRIENEFSGKWSEKNEDRNLSHEECVKEIMKTIFEDSGIPNYEKEVSLF